VVDKDKDSNMLVYLLDALNWNEFKNSVFDENASKSIKNVY
jgi:hypothetical protein